jgi:hypothetical protein
MHIGDELPSSAQVPSILLAQKACPDPARNLAVVVHAASMYTI